MTPWIWISTGLWIGAPVRPFRGEFDHVLSLTPGATPSDDGVRLRSLAPPQTEDQIPGFLDQSTSWLLTRWTAGSKVLIQAQPLAWAELVVAALFVQIGADVDEAISSLRRANPDALTDRRHVEALRAREVRQTSSLDEVKHQFYDHLIDTLGAPPACLPDHGVHVYPDHRGTGPCQCATPTPEQGAR